MVAAERVGSTLRHGNFVRQQTRREASELGIERAALKPVAPDFARSYALLS
jgi:hypothetical protein